MLRKFTLQLLPLVVLFSIAGQTPAQQCNPPAITANSKNYNIFSPEQEMIVGELVNNRKSGDLRFLRDENLQKYLDEIGARLIKHLPATGLKFQFYIVDIPEANAFNIPGGYVYISRKLIGFTNSEDELAGVVAHELGHAVVRHGASGLSELFKKILNVTSVIDRKDIIEKYNLLMERERTKKVSRSSDHESAQQLEADRIGLFSMVAAGYDPNAFASFFDRLVETKGKTGNWFSDIFGKVKPEQKRLREMIKITDQLPGECRENRSNAASRDFLNWQAAVVSYHEATRAEQLSGLLWKKKLVPGLRTDISHFAFSPDGSFLLAQDDFVPETQTGKRVFEKKQFYQLSFFEYLSWIVRRGRDDRTGSFGFFRIVFSPDSRYLAVSRSEFYRFTFRIDGLGAAGSEDTLLALDLSTIKPVGGRRRSQKGQQTTLCLYGIGPCSWRAIVETAGCWHFLVSGRKAIGPVFLFGSNH